MRSLIRLFTALVMLTGMVFAQDTAPAPPPAPKSPAPARIQMRHRLPGLPPPALAHGMGAWWKNSEIIKQLNITDARRKQLEQTFMDYRMKLIDQRADAERQELKLQSLMDADQVDENAISQQLDALIAARGRLEKANAMMNVSMRKILTVEQWKKLQEQSRHLMPMPVAAPETMVAPEPGLFIRRIGPPPSPRLSPGPPDLDN